MNRDRQPRDSQPLKGITWDHSRGYLPLVATAQRHQELGGDDVIWHKRSLKAFGDQPLEQLTRDYDLLIIDHPFVGQAAAHGVLRPLDELLPAEYLQEQQDHSVGASHRSYQADGHQWALATDAATPVASYRPEGMKRHGLDLPRSWDDLMDMASSGHVALAAVPIDTLMALYYLVDGLGGTLFDGEQAMEVERGALALTKLRALLQRCDPACLSRNPILTYEALAQADGPVYCPFAYSYSNYGRRGYAATRLRFADVVAVSDGPARTTLGGTGIAVSAFSRRPEDAARYAAFVNDPVVQRTLYLENGGQPGHRSAWLDPHANDLTNGFFADTLATHDNAYLRPRYDGYLHFQDEAAPRVHAFLQDGSEHGSEHGSNHGSDASATVRELTRLYQASLQGSHPLDAQSHTGGNDAD